MPGYGLQRKEISQTISLVLYFVIILFPLILLMFVPSTLYGQAKDIKHNPFILDALYKGEFMKIGESKYDRLDLGAVFFAYANSGCSIKEGNGDVLGRGWKYFRYFISKEGIDTPDTELMLAQNLVVAHPNYQKTLLDIASQGCGSERHQKILLNLIRLLDERIQWYESDRYSNPPLYSQKETPIILGLLPSLYRIESEKTRDKANKQIWDLREKGFKLLSCSYGPSRPDGTGFSNQTFWYKNVPITKQDLVAVSTNHPLAFLGDLSLTECPATYNEAKDKRAYSHFIANKKIDFASLPKEGKAKRAPLKPGEESNLEKAKYYWKDCNKRGNERSCTLAKHAEKAALGRLRWTCEKAKYDQSNFFCNQLSLVEKELKESIGQQSGK